MDLDVLSGGDVAAPQRRVVLGDRGHDVHLVGVDAAVRELDAHHLLVHLALAVGAHAQTERRELALEFLGVLPVAARFEAVVLDLFVQRDEDVPGFEVAWNLWVGLNGCFERHNVPPGVSINAKIRKSRLSIR